jgi:hypothetical protein
MVKQRSQDGMGFVVGGKKTDTDFMETEDGRLPLAINTNIDQSLNFPAKFNLRSIEGQLQKIQNNPSLFSSYIEALRTRFKTVQETRVINVLEAKIKATQSGMTSQIELVRLQKEYLLAVESLGNIQEDVEIEKLRKKDQKKAIELSIAEKEKAIATLSKDSGSPKAQTDKLNDLRDKLAYGIEKAVLETKMDATRNIRLDEEKEKAKKEATVTILKRYGVSKVEDLPIEGFQELKKQHETINDLFESAKAGRLD